MGYSEATLVAWSDDGQTLFDNAVFWAAGTVPNGAGQLGQPAVPAATVKGLWKLNRLVNQGQPTRYTPDATSNGNHAVPADTAWTAGGAAFVKATGTAIFQPGLAGAAAFTFPGWDDGAIADKTVSPTASAVTVPYRSSFNPNLASDTVLADLSLAALNRTFRVDVYVRPNVPANPGQVYRQSDPSLPNLATPNIVQMGLSDAATDFNLWKISTYPNGLPFCQWRGKGYFLDAAQNPVPAIEDTLIVGKEDTGPKGAGLTRAQVTALLGAQFHVRCERRLGTDGLPKFKMFLWKVVGGVETSVVKPASDPTYGEYPRTYAAPTSAACPIDCTFAGLRVFVKSFATPADRADKNRIWIGKKPTVGNPDDTFSGEIDQLTVTTSVG